MTGPFANPASSTDQPDFCIVKRIGTNDIMTGGTDHYDGHIRLTQYRRGIASCLSAFL